MPGKTIGTAFGSPKSLILQGIIDVLQIGEKFEFEFGATKGGGHAEQVIRKHLESAVKELNGE